MGARRSCAFKIKSLYASTTSVVNGPWRGPRDLSKYPPICIGRLLRQLQSTREAVSDCCDRRYVSLQRSEIQVTFERERHSVAGFAGLQGHAGTPSDIGDPLKSLSQDLPAENSPASDDAA